MGSRKGLGYPSESDPSDSEVNAGDLTIRVESDPSDSEVNAGDLTIRIFPHVRYGVLMACAPRAAPRASLGRGMPGPDLAGPEDRLIGIIS
jgi:hypothetical protein